MNAIQLRRMILDAAEHVPFYRRHWREGGVDLTRIGSAVHLEFLPVVREADLQACPPEDRIDGRYLVRPDASDASSPDIGQPFQLPEDTRTLRRQRARFMRAMNDVGYSFGDRVLSVGPLPFPTGPAFIRWTFLDSRVNADLVLARYIKVRPHVLHAPLPVLVALAHQLKLSTDVTWRPRVVVSTACSLTDANRKLLESTFTVGVADFYSTRTLGLVAYAKPGMKGYRFMTEEFHVEVLPAVAGQRGGPERLVVTDLVAGTMPLIRFDTGDQVLREPSRPGSLAAPPVVSIIGREVGDGQSGMEVDLPDLAGTPDFTQVPVAASRPAWTPRPLYVFQP